MKKLIEIYGNELNLIGSSDDNTIINFEFKDEKLPDSEYQLDDVCIVYGAHFYGDFPIDHIYLEASFDGLILLGTNIIYTLLSDRDLPVCLHLSHPRSKVKRLLINSGSQNKNATGAIFKLCKYVYSPYFKIGKHPWLHHAIDPVNLPTLTLLLNEKLKHLKDGQCAHYWDFLRDRDELMGFGSTQGSLLLAELMLNAGNKKCNQLEFVLEHEGGFRGVGVNSAEMTISLPGSLGYLDAPTRDDQLR